MRLPIFSYSLDLLSWERTRTKTKPLLKCATTAYTTSHTVKKHILDWTCEWTRDSVRFKSGQFTVRATSYKQGCVGVGYALRTGHSSFLPQLQHMTELCPHCREKRVTSVLSNGLTYIQGIALNRGKDQLVFGCTALDICCLDIAVKKWY